MALYTELMFTLFEQIQQVLESPFFQLGNSALSLSAIAQFLLIILVAFVAAWALRRSLSLRLLKHLGLRQGTRESILER